MTSGEDARERSGPDRDPCERKPSPASPSTRPLIATREERCRGIKRWRSLPRPIPTTFCGPVGRAAIAQGIRSNFSCPVPDSNSACASAVSAIGKVRCVRRRSFPEARSGIARSMASGARPGVGTDSRTPSEDACSSARVITLSAPSARAIALSSPPCPAESRTASTFAVSARRDRRILRHKGPVWRRVATRALGGPHLRTR